MYCCKTCGKFSCACPPGAYYGHDRGTYAMDAIMEIIGRGLLIPQKQKLAEALVELIEHLIDERRRQP